MGLFRYCKKNTSWSYILLILGIVYLWHGYQFGRNDQIEWIPYSLKIASQRLYPNDLYISHISDQWPNERWGLSKVMSFFAPILSYVSFFVHFASLTALIIGLWKLSDLWIRTSIFKLAAILLLLIVLSRTSAGDNEIYYNYLVSSVPAKALGVWSILFVIRNKWLISSILLCLATYLQTIVGIQLFLLILGTSLLISIVERKFTKHLLGGIGIYLLGCGWWLWSLFMHTSEKAEISLYELFAFRLPHHYFPGTFAFEEIMIFGIISGFSIWFGVKSKSKFIWLFNVLVLIGVLIYSLAVEYFHSEFFLKTQWFKTTLWAEMWFAILILAFFERFVHTNKLFSLSQWLILGGIVGLMYFTINYRNPYYEFPWNQIDDPEIEMAIRCKELTDPGNVFLVPFSNSTFRIWSERNVYVDFKSVLHSPKYLNKWRSRINKIYGLKIPSAHMNSLEKKEIADQHYYNLTQRELDKIESDYFITKISHQLPYPVFIQNSNWIAYDLR